MENHVDDSESDSQSEIFYDCEEHLATESKYETQYADKIKVDDKWQWSTSIENVEQMIKKHVKYYIENKEKLECNNDAFPSDYALAHMSSMSYNEVDDHKDLLKGWVLLTRVSNSEFTNGYHGCAYFNKEHQQIVIGHRGTPRDLSPQTLKVVWNDFKGVVFSKFVSQMNSAITFTEEILKLVEAFNQKGAYLKVSFTGHSLGGWLAQVTTFTAKYLMIDERQTNQFTLIKEPQMGYHAHTVVFESPGCKQMLENLKKEYIEFRYGDENVIEISIDSLDITTYLSAPNRINCCNEHVGKVYRIFIDLSDQKCEDNRGKSWVVRLVTDLQRRAANLWKSVNEYLLYSVYVHGIDKIVSCFDPLTGLVKRGTDGKLDVQVVLNWPILEGTVFAGSEYKRFFKWASKFNNYNPNVPQDEQFPNANRKIRYRTKNFDEKKIHWNHFNEMEIHFVHGVDILQFFKTYESVLFSVETDDNKWALHETIKTLDSMKFQIDCDRGVPLLGPNIKPLDFISFVKQLIRFFPHLNRVKRTTKGFTFDLVTEIYKTESLKYLIPIRKNSLEFDRGSFNLYPFLKKINPQVLLQVEEDTSIGALKIYKLFESIKSRTIYNKDNSMFLDMKTIWQLKHLKFASILAQIKANFLIMVENNESTEAVECLKQILKEVRGNQNIKLILIVKREREIDWEEIVGKCEQSHHEGICLCDLSTDNRQLILKRMLINFQGHHVSLAQIIPGIEKLKSGKDLIKMATDTNRELDVRSDYIINSRFDVFAVSNITPELFQTMIPPGERVTLYKDWDQSDMVRFIIMDKAHAQNQFENIGWHLSHKSRIHWLDMMENRLILKDSKSHSDGDNDTFIEKLFTEKFEKSVHEVLIGCFIIIENDDTDEFFDHLSNENIQTLIQQEFRDCLVIGKNGDCYQLNEKVDKERISQMCEYFRRYANRDEMPSLHDCNERVFYGNQEVLSGCFVSGESMKSISSSGKALLKSVTSSEVLMKLGSKAEIKAGRELHQLGDIEDYYIERTLTKPAKVIDVRKLDASIKNDIYAICNAETDKFPFDDKDFKKNAMMFYETWVSVRHSERIHLIILDTEKSINQFNNICEFYPDKNIHFLIPAGEQPELCIDNMDRNPLSELVSEERVVLLTHMLLRVSSEEIDDHRYGEGHIAYKECYQIGKSDKLRSIEDIRDAVVTVKGMPGMGKSTFFTNLAIQKKNLYPFLWVFKLKLHTIPWDNLVKLERPFKKEQVLEFLAQILKLESEFEKSLFEYCLYDKKVVLILDAFDEASPKYDNQIFGLLETLQTEMKVKQLWLSSRPYALKDGQSMGTVYTLQGLERSDQSRFFLIFWRKLLKIDIDPVRCNEFSSNLKRYRPHDFHRYDDNSITRAPQILKVLAENYKDDFEAFYKYDREIKVQEFSIHKYYERIIDKNINKLYGEKLAADTKIQAADIESKKRRKTTIAEHKLLALVSCYLDSLVCEQRSEINYLIDSISNGEENTGFVSGIVNGVPQFIHATFAEYFAALWLIEMMTAAEDNVTFIKLFKGLAKLFRRGSDVVYSLFDSQLGDNKMLEDNLTNYLRGNKDLVECLAVGTERTYRNIFRFMVNFDVDYYAKVVVDANPFSDSIEDEDKDEFEHICHHVYGDECDFKSIIMKYHLLHLAAKRNATRPMTLFLLSKVSNEHLLNVLNDMLDGSAPLHVAVENNQLAVVKVLIENGAEVNLRDKNGFTALDLAVKNQNVEMIAVLLDNWVIYSPLDFVMTCEPIIDIDVAKFFMEFIQKCFEQCSKCLTYNVNDYGPSQMCTVVGSTNHSLINSLITSGPEEISWIKYDLTSLLHSERPVINVSDVMNATSHYHSNERFFVALIGNVALKYPNYLSHLFCLKNGEEETLLHIAARSGYVRTAELMVGLGADIDLRNGKGETALMIAASCGKLAFVVFLLGQRDEVINKAVNLADLRCDESAVELLVDFVDQHLSDLLSKRYDGGDTMLHIAAQSNVVKAAEILIDRGADVSVRNDDNHTPLSLACKSGHLQMVRLLINKGASVNDLQQSPLLWAIYSCSFEMILILIINGADVNAKCPFPFAVNKCMNVWTPLQLAVDRHKLHKIDFNFYRFLLTNGVDFTTAFSNMPFHLTQEYAHLIVFFIMFGADIYTTNNEGVSLVTYLERHWQSKVAVLEIMFIPVILFSKRKPPRPLLEIIERSVAINYNLGEVVYVIRFKKQIKEKMPEFYKLINACKWKDIVQIEKHLGAVLIDESEFNIALNSIDKLISAEIPCALPDRTVMYLVLRSCVTFIHLIINLLIISDGELNPKLTLYDQLRICCYEPLLDQKSLGYPKLRVLSNISFGHNNSK